MISVAQADVEARLRRVLTTAEVTYLPGVIDEASAFVEGYLGVIYADDDDVPDAVTIAMSRVVARMLSDTGVFPAQADSRSTGMGPFSVTTHYVEGSTSGGPWLTKSDKIALDPYRVGGFTSMRLVRESGS